jgi:hypothetical protein
MKTVLKASDVRREWSKFIDEVKWVKPAYLLHNQIGQYCKRNSPVLQS